MDSLSKDKLRSLLNEYANAHLMLGERIVEYNNGQCRMERVDHWDREVERVEQELYKELGL